jgi:predicted DsbA family dithiol-disulfide isomerase
VAAGFDADAAGELLASDGFDQQVRDDQAQAHERGISGVPAFVIDDEWIIPGAQDTERMVQLLGRVRQQR